MANISQYHGAVRKCTCGLADNPERVGERACPQCKGRGFVAACKACDGKGQVEQDMAGGPGKMKSTCIPCGGSGLFAVNKPADWDERHPEQAKEAEAAAADVPDPVIGAGVDNVYPDAESALKAGDKGWVTPPPSQGHVHNTPIGGSITSALS